jgi:hypothetical protein
MDKNHFWEVNSQLYSQEVPHFYGAQRFVTSVYKNMPLDIFLSLMNPLHTLISCFLRFIASIILWCI